MGDGSFGIFCRTYHKDAVRLRYTLRSVEKFCKGFASVVVATPESSADVIRSVVNDFPFVKLVICTGTSFDFIGQQITKLTAHRFMDTEYVIHIDSDCVFTRVVTPEDYKRDGYPILYHAPYSYFYENGINLPWQSVTSFHLRRQVDLEFMRQFPMVYPRRLYQDLNDWYEATHGEGFDNLQNRVHGDHFSEFNLLGSFSYYADERYHTHINVLEEAPVQTVTQFLLQGRDNREMAPEDLAVLENILSGQTLDRDTVRASSAIPALRDVPNRDAGDQQAS